MKLRQQPNSPEGGLKDFIDMIERVDEITAGISDLDPEQARNLSQTLTGHMTEYANPLLSEGKISQDQVEKMQELLIKAWRRAMDSPELDEIRKKLQRIDKEHQKRVEEFRQSDEYRKDLERHGYDPRDFGVDMDSDPSS